MIQLISKKCVPCIKGSAALSTQEASLLLTQLQGWEMHNESNTLQKSYKYKNFAQALDFVNKIAALAETENHHPDIAFGWGYVTITLQTHSIGGLHENDFIVAAKIDALQ